uniref:Uncharacterized protein n=1 Tax=Panagrolaimus superbus TaxID=310955 RepID=A0A914YGH1_9BILA
MELLKFFDKYDFQSLKDDLEAELISEIDESNVCLLTNCSLLSNASKLEEESAEFLQHCLKTSNPVADFDLLDKNFAMNLLKNSFYHVSK